MKKLNYESIAKIEKIKINNYVEDIKRCFNWNKIRNYCLFGNNADDDMIYLGDITNIFPSGKYYTPWANSNVDRCYVCNGTGKIRSKDGNNLTCHKCCGRGRIEAFLDECYSTALDKVAEEYGLAIVSGEGNPLDLFVISQNNE